MIRVRLLFISCLILPTAANAADSCASALTQALASQPVSQPVFTEVDAPSRYRGDTYGPKADLIIARGARNDTAVQAGLGGDDTFFLLSQNVADQIVAGSGADTVHVCDLPQGSIALGDGDAFHDGDVDTVVFYPEVFEAAEAAGGAEVMVHQFGRDVDRLVFVLPEGSVATPQVDANLGLLSVRVGTLTVDINDNTFFRARSTARPQIDVRYGTSDSLPEAPETPAPIFAERIYGGWPAVETPSPQDLAAFPGCQQTATARDWSAADELTPTSIGGSFGGTITFDAPRVDFAFIPQGYDSTVSLTPGADAVLIHQASDAGFVETGRGADVVVLCSMAGSLARLLVSGGWGGTGNRDADPDTIVVDLPVFADAPTGGFREVHISGFVPEEDQLILVTPGGAAPQWSMDQDNVFARLGDVLITIQRPYSQGDLATYTASVTVTQDPMAAANALASKPTQDTAFVSPEPPGSPMFQNWADAVGFDGTHANLAQPALDCGAPLSTNFQESPETEESAGIAEYRVFGDGNDMVAAGRNGPEQVAHVLGRGDDVFYDLVGGVFVDPGFGADALVLCDFQQTSQVLSIGPDIEPDLVVLGPEVFRSVTPGSAPLRQIQLQGFVGQNDRLVIVMPAEARAERFGALRNNSGNNSLRIALGDQITEIEILPYEHPDRLHVDLPDSAFVFVPEAKP